jgi:hypothetical protein
VLAILRARGRWICSRSNAGINIPVDRVTTLPLSDAENPPLIRLLPKSNEQFNAVLLSLHQALPVNVRE